MTGVSFVQLRQCLYYLYFGKDYPAEKAYKYIVPFQRNYESPLQAGEFDTYIQYSVDRDIRITQDAYNYDKNEVHKVAFCHIRFVGTHAEEWAKVFHHLTKRSDTAQIWWDVCHAELLEGVGDIIAKTIDYFGTGASIAFDIHFKLHYIESIDCDWSPLKGVSLASGNVNY